MSTGGYGIFFCSMSIGWRSRSQQIITLSSAEAEYVAMTEMVQEMLFIQQVVESIGITIELPMKVYCDNLGAIYMANNKSTRFRTKHMDVQYHFIQQLINEGIIFVSLYN